MLQKPGGFYVEWKHLKLYFGLKLAYLIFSTSEQLSINMQAVKITIQEVIHGAELLVSKLKEIRVSFTAFMKIV